MAIIVLIFLILAIVVLIFLILKRSVVEVSYTNLIKSHTNLINSYKTLIKSYTNLIQHQEFVANIPRREAISNMAHALFADSDLVSDATVPPVPDLVDARGNRLLVPNLGAWRAAWSYAYAGEDLESY